MKRTNIFSIFLSLLFLMLSTTYSQDRMASGKLIKSAVWKNQQIRYVDQEICVKLSPGFSKESSRFLAKKIDATILEDFDKLGWGLIQISKGKDIHKEISRIQSYAEVLIAEPNIVGTISVDPNDPYFIGTSPASYPHQWSLNNFMQSPPAGMVDADIDATQAWDIATGSPDVVIAVLDSGIPLQDGSLSHHDLDDINKIILGTDFVDNGEGVRDILGHGTHVAGIAAAETDNNTGVSEVACVMCR